MTATTITSRLDGNGVLHLTVPLDPGLAEKEVRVTIEPQSVDVTQEEWERKVMKLAGSWKGEFERPEQLPLEERDPL